MSDKLPTAPEIVAALDRYPQLKLQVRRLLQQRGEPLRAPSKDKSDAQD